jgi:hypothetical protein
MDNQYSNGKMNHNQYVGSKKLWAAGAGVPCAEFRTHFVTSCLEYGTLWSCYCGVIQYYPTPLFIRLCKVISEPANQFWTYFSCVWNSGFKTTILNTAVTLTLKYLYVSEGKGISVWLNI